jgi:hypothetical protein
MAASGAFLASCSSGASVVPGSRVLNPAGANAARGIQAAASTTALGHQGFQLSSNVASTAVAMHNTAGDFMCSAVLTPKFMRATDANGKQSIIPVNLHLLRGWYVLDNGSKFKKKKLKSGAPALLTDDGFGNKKLLSFGGKHLFVRDQKTRTTQKIALITEPVRGTTVSATAASSLASTIDNHGIWMGDEDFAAVAQSLGPLGSIVSTPRRGARSSQRSTQSFYSGTYGGNGGNYGDAGYSYLAGVPDPVLCSIDFELLAAAWILYAAATVGLAACATVVACALAIAAYAAAALALDAARTTYQHDGC